MSMLATFIQIEPRLLQRMHADRELAEQLFMPVAPVPAGFDPDTMRALIRARGPALMAGTMDMHPQLREALERRLGTTQDELRRGAAVRRSCSSCRSALTELRVYPFGWDAESLDWLISALRDLRGLCSEAAAQGWAIVTCLE